MDFRTRTYVRTGKGVCLTGFLFGFGAFAGEKIFYPAAISARLDCEISQCVFVPDCSEDNAMVLIDITNKDLKEETSEMMDDEDWEVEYYESIKNRYDKDFNEDYPKFSCGYHIDWN